MTAALPRRGSGRHAAPNAEGGGLLHAVRSGRGLRRAHLSADQIRTVWSRDAETISSQRVAASSRCAAVAARGRGWRQTCRINQLQVRHPIGVTRERDHTLHQSRRVGCANARRPSTALCSSFCTGGAAVAGGKQLAKEMVPS